MGSGNVSLVGGHTAVVDWPAPLGRPISCGRRPRATANADWPRVCRPAQRQPLADWLRGKQGGGDPGMTGQGRQLEARHAAQPPRSVWTLGKVVVAIGWSCPLGPLGGTFGGPWSHSHRSLTRDARPPRGIWIVLDWVRWMERGRCSGSSAKDFHSTGLGDSDSAVLREQLCLPSLSASPWAATTGSSWHDRWRPLPSLGFPPSDVTR